jgi:hypothetical protein
MKWAHLSRPIPVIEDYPVIYGTLLSGRRVVVSPAQRSFPGKLRSVNYGGVRWKPRVTTLRQLSTSTNWPRSLPIGALMPG